MKLVIFTILGLALWPHAARRDAGQNCEQHEGRVYTMSQVDEKARVKRRPPPVFPEEARRRRIRGGEVKMRVVLRPGRAVTEVEVLETSHELFSETSVEAARKIEFEPAKKGGCPVAQSVLIINYYSTR